MKKTKAHTKAKRNSNPLSPFQAAQKADRELAKFYGMPHATKPAQDNKSAKRELAEFESNIPALIRRALWYAPEGDEVASFMEWQEIRKMLSNLTEELRKPFERLIRRNPMFWNCYIENRNVYLQRQRLAERATGQWKKRRGRPQKNKIAREVAELRRQVPQPSFKRIAATLNQQHQTEDKNHPDHATDESVRKLLRRH